ncbi:sugar phosphate nucleotidyltransferase [Patescibacteria group bacterium]
MRAVILAAGKGTRLLPVTEYTPKPLVEIHRKPIMAYQLDALYEGGVSNVTVVVGYLGESTKAFVEHYNREHNTNAEVIISEDYETTNNMYSLWLARDQLEDGCIVSNGDVIYSSQIISALLSSKHGSAIAVTPHMYDEESMKVQLRNNQSVSHIDKKISEADADAVSIDLYKFSPQDTTLLLKRCQEIIVDEKRLTDWTEVAIQDILEQTKIYTVDLDVDDSWIEIDTHEDWERAESVIPKPKNIHGKKQN